MTHTSLVSSSCPMHDTHCFVDAFLTLANITIIVANDDDVCDLLKMLDRNPSNFVFSYTNRILHIIFMKYEE